ncbi:MAG TPA: hypothetical protein VGG46_03040, partial [Terriglobales bacterium]
MVEKASAQQVEYLTRAKGYLEEAIACARAAREGAVLWRLGVVSIGSSLESLLRIKYGEEPRDLFALVDKFDDDSYFDQMKIHIGSQKACSTC